MTGISTCLTISFNALDDDSSGHETLTKSAPSSWIELICFIVATTSVVKVLVIDCTVMGLSPPTFTFPTLILFLNFPSNELPSGNAGLSLVDNYEVVIWYSGWNTNVFSSSETSVLGDYLEGECGGSDNFCTDNRNIILLTAGLG